jgi:phosphate uptake regulator
MEIRKVQITGGSSFVISLPKEWAQSMNIKKNDPLGLIVQSDGTLVVTPRIDGEQAPRVKEFEVTHISDPVYLFRCLIGAYIMGYTSITLTSQRRLQPFIRKVVRDFTQMTMGQEVVEETDTSIHLKDLLNPIEMPFENSIKRMYVIVKNMYRDAIMALESGNKALAEDVVARDNEVDRLQWLIARQYNLILKDANLSKKMGITPSMASNYYIISRIIERVGDHAVRIAVYVPTLIDEKGDAKIVQEIKSATDIALGIFDNSIRSFFAADIRELNKNIESIEKLERVSDNINSLALQKKGAVAISVGYITESIRRAGEYAGDISENVINHIVDTEG